MENTCDTSIEFYPNLSFIRFLAFSFVNTIFSISLHEREKIETYDQFMGVSLQKKVFWFEKN